MSEDLQELLDQANETISELEEQVDGLKTDLQQLSDENDELEDRIDELELDLETQNELIDNIKRLIRGY